MSATAALGALPYHHISDTYIALFSHFIACGVGSGVYILDGLLKNLSALRPTRCLPIPMGKPNRSLA